MDEKLTMEYLKELLINQYRDQYWENDWSNKTYGLDSEWDDDFSRAARSKIAQASFKQKEKEYLKKNPKETEYEKVARILKGDFESKFGMTFEKFTETYHEMMEVCPEKLI